MKNIHFESELTDDREYMYIITCIKDGKKYKIAVSAASIDEASKEVIEVFGNGTFIKEYEKISKSEYKQEKL